MIAEHFWCASAMKCPREGGQAGSELVALGGDARFGGGMRVWRRLGAAAGLVGPAGFTAGWVAASLRQTGHSATGVQLSGLAAPDARDPGIMIASFVLLGGCSVAFGGTLHGALRPRPGPAPRLIQCAGLLTVAAGLLRRDHMMLGRPGTGQSWHNHAHDAVSAVIYLLLAVVPLLLAARFRGDSHWRPLAVPALAAGLATAGFLGLFVTGTSAPSAGLLQRIAVSIPLALLAAVAVRLLAVPDPATERHGAALR
jgi:hypothetical protein